MQPSSHPVFTLILMPLLESTLVFQIAFLKLPLIQPLPLPTLYLLPSLPGPWSLLQPESRVLSHMWGTRFLCQEDFFSFFSSAYSCPIVEAVTLNYGELKQKKSILTRKNVDSWFQNPLGPIMGYLKYQKLLAWCLSGSTQDINSPVVYNSQVSLSCQTVTN